MGAYKISIKASAVKELERLPKDDLARVFGRIYALEAQPRPVGAIKLAATDLYRVRQGDYRILYSIDDNSARVEVIKVGHRRDAYR